MKRCADSQSVAMLPVMGQLLWHRLVHDGGIDEWGCCQGSARMVWRNCMAGTVDCSVEDVEVLLQQMVGLQMIWLYEVDGCRYLATVNHELYQDWRQARRCPEVPMTQEVADSRNFESVSTDQRRHRNERDNVIRWARRWCLCIPGYTDDLAATQCTSDAHEMHTARTRDAHYRGSSSVGVGVGVRGGGSTAQACAKSAPLPHTDESTDTSEDRTPPIRVQVLVAAGLTPTEQSEQQLATALDTLRSEPMQNGQAVASAAAYAAYCSSHGKKPTVDGLIRSLARDDAHHAKQATSGVPPGRGRRYHPPEAPYDSAEAAKQAAERWNAGRDVHGQPRERRADDAGDGRGAA